MSKSTLEGKCHVCKQWAPLKRLLRWYVCGSCLANLKGRMS